jgi:cytochrome P450
VATSQSTGIPDADLGSLEFWGLPARERDLYFEQLRRDAPISRHEPPEDILGLPDQGRMHYWAIVLYDDIRRISRDPATFCSGQGVPFADAMLRVIPDIEAGEPELLRSAFIHGVKRMPCTFTARA